MTATDRKAHMARLAVVANAKRSAKARLKREVLRLGAAGLAAVILDPPAAIHGVAVGTVLEYGRGVGAHRAGRIMCGVVRGHEAIEHLSPVTRRRLAARVRASLDDAR